MHKTKIIQNELKIIMRLKKKEQILKYHLKYKTKNSKIIYFTVFLCYNR